MESRWSVPRNWKCRRKSDGFSVLELHLDLYAQKVLVFLWGCIHKRPNIRDVSTSVVVVKHSFLNKDWKETHSARQDETWKSFKNAFPNSTDNKKRKNTPVVQGRIRICLLCKAGHIRPRKTKSDVHPREGMLWEYTQAHEDYVESTTWPSNWTNSD